MNSFKQGISSPPPKKSVQFWAFQLNLRFCLKNSRRTDPHSRMSDMCKKTTLVVPMDSKLLSNYWYMSWPSWPTHISKLCSHKNQG